MTVLQQSIDASEVFILRPNRSASWRENRYLLWAVGGVTFGIAIAWAVVGVWLVLPFAGLEIAALTYVIMKVLQSGKQQQVIRVNADRIIVEEGVEVCEQRWLFDRQDTRVNVIESQVPVAAIELFLVNKALCLPIASFLNQQEREQLRQGLQRAGVSIHSNKWWQANSQKRTNFPIE